MLVSLIANIVVSHSSSHRTHGAHRAPRAKVNDVVRTLNPYSFLTMVSLSQIGSVEQRGYVGQIASLLYHRLAKVLKHHYLLSLSFSV